MIKFYYKFWSPDISKHCNIFVDSFQAIERTEVTDHILHADLVLLMNYEPPRYTGVLGKLHSYYLKWFKVNPFRVPDIRGELSDQKIIFYTEENVRPKLDLADLSLGFDYEDTVHSDKYLRLPFYTVLGWKERHKLYGAGRREIIANKSADRFCEFLYSQPIANREQFFHKLNAYQTVDAPGKSCNNMPPLGSHDNPVSSRQSDDWVTQRLEFAQSYKFSIAFENTSYPGYTTEKICNAFIAGCIPIYWGNPRIAEDFNPEAFINVHDFNTIDEVVERVREINEDDELYQAMLDAPVFVNDELPEVYSLTRLSDKIAAVMNS